MTYEYLTTDQFKRVVNIAQVNNIKPNRLIDLIIDWCEFYNSIDDLLNDLEKVIA